MKKNIFSIILSLAISLSMCSCNSNTPDSSNTVNQAQNDDNKVYFVNKPISYSFPEFLSEKENISMFSRLLYQNFDYEKTNTVLDENEKTNGGYVCDMNFANGKLKRFKYTDKFGIIDDEDNIKLHGNYTSITQLRPDLFELCVGNKKSYATIDDDNNFQIIDDDSFSWVFKKNGLKISPVTSDTVETGVDVADGVKYVLKTSDGKTVYDKSFDIITELSKDNYDIDCEYIYSAYSGDNYYFLVFDKYYNYAVYEGTYGNIDVQIDEDKGSCYILNFDHYLQILSLTSCFDYTDNTEASKSDNYVFIDFSVSKNNQSKFLICDNGYCEITNPSEETGESIVKKYTVSKECFADVVDWINLNLSEDY